jgi:hypothetical protein
MSPVNFVNNHIGHFAAAGHAIAKAIFLGGVARRLHARLAARQKAVPSPRKSRSHEGWVSS